MIGHVTDSIYSSNAHASDERDPGSGSWNYDSRPILAALRSLSLKPISFGYKTPPVRFSQAGGQSAHKARPPNLELALTPLLCTHSEYCIVVWPTTSCFADWSKRRHVTFSIIEWRAIHGHDLVTINRWRTVVSGTWKYDDPTLNMSHEGSARVWHVQPRVVLFPRPTNNCVSYVLSSD